MNKKEIYDKIEGCIDSLKRKNNKGVEEYVKNVLDRRVEYSRYTAIDILQLLPELYILGKYHDWWYCKDSTDSWGDIVYYKTAEEACANVYEKLLNGDMHKGGE